MMWKQKLQLILLLLIWATLIRTGEGLEYQSSTDEDTMKLNPSIITFDLQNPVIVLTPKQFDEHDRALEVQPLKSGRDLVGWAGQGDHRNTSKVLPPLSFPKWVPDSHPVKEKHWTAIVEALESTATQPPQQTFIKTPPHTGLRLHSDLQTTETPDSFNKFSIDNLFSPELFNPLQVFLPNQKRRHDNQRNTDNRRQHNRQNLHVPLKINSNNDETSKTLTFTTWPNTGHNDALQGIAEEDIKQLTQPVMEKRPTYDATFDQAPSSQLSATSMATKNAILWPDLANAQSSPLQSVHVSSTNLGQFNHTNNNDKPTQWPDFRDTTSTRPFPASPQLKNNTGKIFFQTDTVSPNKQSTYSPPEPMPNKISNLPVPPVGTTFNNPLYRKDDTQNEGTKALPNLENHPLNKDLHTQSDKISEAAKEVYSQPWLHAAVQHDLKEWGYPYDNSAPPNPFKYTKQNHLLTNQSRVSGDSTASQQILPHYGHIDTQESHITEHYVPGPAGNKRARLNAPKHGKKPILLPIDSISIDISPYFREATSLHSISKPDAPLNVPYESQIINHHTSDTYQANTPHKSAVERQGGNAFRNIMRPFRNIFQLGREPRNNLPNRQQFTRQLPSPQNLPTEMQPPPILFSQFPDFGPPKGDDIVSEVQHQQENEVGGFQESFNSEQLEPETILDDTNPNLLFQQQPEGEAQGFFLPPADLIQQNNIINNQNTQGETQFEPPILAHNEDLPPFPNTIQDEPSFFNPPTLPNPAPSTNPPFIPWPNLRTTATTTLVPTEPPPTSQPGFSFFNQSPTLRPFRLPTLPRMRFLNPFNVFRSRETPNTNTNGIFSWFPSLTSKTDNQREEDTENKGTNWPNLKLGSDAHEFPLHPVTTDVNIRPLRNVGSSNKNKGNGFTFKPQLSTVIHHNKPTLPFVQNTLNYQTHATISPHYKLSTALSQSPEIHQINQSDNVATKVTHTSHNLPTSTEKYFDDEIFIVSSDNDDQQLKGDSAVNPQTNPARKSFPQTDSYNESLGPSMIKFTIDDVIDSSFRDNGKQFDTKLQSPNTKGAENLQLTGDMEFAPSEEKAIVAVFQDAATPPSILADIDNQTNTDSQSIPDTTTKNTLMITLVPQNSRNITSGNENLPSNLKQVKPKFQLPMTHFSKPTTPTSSTTASVTTNSPIYSGFTSSHIPFEALSENKPVRQIFSSIATPLPTPQNQATTAYAPNTNPLSHHFPSTLKPSTYHLNKNSEIKYSNPILQQPHTSNIHNSNLKIDSFVTTTRTPHKSNFVTINWRDSIPDENSPHQLSDNQGRSKIKGFMPEASSRITIIEATPMPKEGEVFPTAKYFKTMPSSPKTTTPGYDHAATQEITTIPTSSPSILLWRNNATPSSLVTTKQVLMPGHLNHRTMTMLPKVDSGLTINNDGQNLTKHSQNHTNKFKITYNSPARKISHAHKTEKPALEMEALSTSLISSTLIKMTDNQHIPNRNPAEETGETNTYQRVSTVEATEQKPQALSTDLQKTLHASSLSQNSSQNTKSDQEKTLISTTSSTTRPLLAGRQTRYNSLQRLRDFMASKRNDKNETSTTEPTTLPTYHLSTSSPLPNTTPTQITSPSLHHTSYRSSKQRVRLSTTITPPQRTTPTTRQPWYTLTTTTLPTATASISHSSDPSNFKQTDHELSGSSSKTSYEWRPPIHDVDLQDHPEMFDLYNWESAKVDKAQDRYDTSSNLHYESEADEKHTNSWLPGQNPQASSHIRIPRSNPIIILKEKQALSSSIPQVQDDTTTFGHINRAWKNLKENSGHNKKR
ncbi:mucin-2-like [Macrobrachium nipponense]|uniref:mucin-2-like n=1 Tax=Macrobrachium nipponense TaxID=159736 RepID=UPI0030C7B099